MVKKKRSINSRIRKKDEETVDKRMIIGAVLTTIFLLLFLFTQPGVKNAKKSFEELTPQEKIDQVQISEQQVLDKTSYQRALTFRNNIYCDEIKDEVMKAECIEKVPERAEQEPVNEISQNEILDRTNYQRALTFQNKEYCEPIQDVKLKNECLSAIEG